MMIDLPALRAPTTWPLQQTAGRAHGDKLRARATATAFYAGRDGALPRGHVAVHACHGAGSPWGADDQRLHAAYERQLEESIDFRTRRSAVLDPFLTTDRVNGTPARWHTPSHVSLRRARTAERRDGCTGVGKNSAPGRRPTRANGMAPRGPWRATSVVNSAAMSRRSSVVGVAMALTSTRAA